MNVLFITKANVKSIYERGIYADLLREFKNNGDNVYIVTPNERRNKQKTTILNEDNSTILSVKTGNLQKVNVIEKGLATLSVERRFKRAIKKYFKDVKFDLVLYSTPPVVFAKVVQYVKKRDGAKSYLLLKDIFPQNAIDLGMLKKHGLRGLIYSFFRAKERKLYKVSDKIGCMSEANCEYLLKHNKNIPKEKVELCPNTVEYSGLDLTREEKIALRSRYGLPEDKTIFVYGGNLGKPQGIPFIIECLKTQENNDKAFFLIVGDGTEFDTLKAYVKKNKPKNVKIMRRLPKTDYGKIVAACDIGMLFLDHRFTIPNFPSRMLSYMQESLPVLACTDCNTDVGKVIVDGGFGWWCESNDANAFIDTVNKALSEDLEQMGASGKEYLLANYLSEHSYRIITESVK